MTPPSQPPALGRAPSFSSLGTMEVTTSDLKKVYVGISGMFVHASRSLKTAENATACGTNILINQPNDSDNIHRGD
jgi:hypothetical protein